MSTATTQEDLSPIFESLRAGSGLPALAGAVWKGGQLVAIGATGYRKFGNSTRVTIDDRWHIGSDTKAMTATLAGILIDRGLLSFDDTLGKLFLGEDVAPGYLDVTLEQLLRHRGGAPSQIPPAISRKMWLQREPNERQDVVRALLSQGPASPTGTYIYSNAGYMIVGAVLETIANQSWEQLMQDELFKPLKMNSCGFGPPGSASRFPDEPWGHVALFLPIPVRPGPNADNPLSLGPAGTVHTSLADWGNFLALHLRGARKETTPLVSLETIKRLQSPPEGGDYACGWLVTQRPWAGGDGTALTHSGSNTMWYATAWLAPAKDIAFAVVANRGDGVAAKVVNRAFAPLIERWC